MYSQNRLHNPLAMITEIWREVDIDFATSVATRFNGDVISETMAQDFYTLGMLSEFQMKATRAAR